MTYSSRGRSLTETILAAILGGFLTGFILVLCIGNFYRAKRAMERQRERRRLQQTAGGALRQNGTVDDDEDDNDNDEGEEGEEWSPGRSSYVMTMNHNHTQSPGGGAGESQHLLSTGAARQRSGGGRQLMSV